MPQIMSVAQLEEGATLAEPILNKQGMMLLPAGAVIEAKHLRLLRTWGIQDVSLQSADDEMTDDDSEFSEEVRQLAEERLKARWRWSPRRPIEQELYDCALEHTCQTIVHGSKAQENHA